MNDGSENEIEVAPTAERRLRRTNLARVGEALSEPRFRLLLLGSFISNVGSWMQSVAQAWLVLQLTNSPFFLGLDAFANSVPLTLFAFWGGAIADRVNRQRLLVVTQTILLGLALILGVLITLNIVKVWHIILLSFILGAAQAVAWPAYQGLIVNLVEPRSIANAIALNSAQFNMARLIGPLLGAYAMATIGMAGCFYLNAASFVAVLYSLWKMGPQPGGQTKASVFTGVVQSIREGFSYARKERWLSAILIILASISILALPLMMLLPVLAKDVLQIGATGLGHLVSAFGAGAVIGGLFFAILGDFRRKGLFISGSLAVMVISMWGLGLSRHLGLSLIILIIAGFAFVGTTAVINTLIQKRVPDRLRGRAISLYIFCFAGFMPLGSLLAGTLAERTSATATLIILGSALALSSLAVGWAFPELKSLD